jgi:glycolate oxidase FAD binding subunit
MSKIDKLISKLKEIVGEANIFQDPDQLKAYGLDGKKPKVVISPGTIDEVSKVVAFSNEQHLTIIPRGNGTKMGMGRIPKKMDIILSTKHLNRITDFDYDNLTISVESGITLKEVQDRLAREGKGYFIPLDPAFTDRATLGGIAATNSSGPKRLLYGTARDLTIGMKIVFPNGDMVVSGGKTVKNVSGYDMCKLLIGSYGTLGIICEMTLKLLPLPEKEATLWVPFKRLEEVDKFVHEIKGSQLLPASIEILNSMAVKKIGLEGVAESIDRQITEIGHMVEKHGALEIVTLSSEKHNAFWIALRNFSKRLAGDYPNLLSLKSNILISECGEMVGEYEKITRKFGMDCAFVCHSGSGILYSYVLTGKSWRSKIESLIEFIRRLSSEAVKHGGNLVVESSPLLIKKKVDVWGQSRDDYRVMRRLKEQIDPTGIFNPGRFLGGI